MFEVFKASCNHEKVTLNIRTGYCPDCGELVENNWYIMRCKCCGIKQKAIIRFGKVVSLEKYCRNCGNNSFAIEELEKLDIVNINYAVIKKRTRNIRKENIFQTWIENNYTPIKLLPIY